MVLLSRIVWEEYVNVEMWIQFMFHLSAVYDKVQSFVATVTLKQCVHILEQQIVEEYLLSLV
jgi:hypothetical protein